jgi:hypothetical protein
MEIQSPKYNYSIKYHAKSACTLVRRLFLELHGDEISEEERNKMNQWHDIHLFFPVKNIPTKTLNIVRNPYERVVSIFVNKICGGEPHNILGKKLKIRQISFSEFILFMVDMKIKHGKYFGMFDDHLLPQSVNYRISDLVIKLKNLEEGLKINLPSEFSENITEFFKNVNDNKVFVNKSNYAEETFEFVGNKSYSIDDKGPWPNWKCFYDETLKDLVHFLYKDDFELFFND